ncbi:MAG: prepilin-type N-terminal cleavage/methylation domain-containing protein, partial [Pseudomonadota bacterium]|nr:prepilin-type N-terminal cleavage/methylation domain-containing protein [Pseudomonadota bacterium]
MKMTPTRRGHAGFSLVELMVAMAITMALSVGMLNLLMSTRSTSLAQNALEQVQEDQRLVLARLIDTVQNAGYFPGALNSSASTVFTSTQAPFTATGQVVYGVSGTGAPGDTLVVRYQAGLPANGDQTLDCSGSTNTTAGNLMMTNQFNVDASGNLVCTVNGTAVPLAAGVSNFQVLYGVDTNSDGSA